jgi:hypothetical protein
LQLGAAWNKSSQLAWYFLRRTTWSNGKINREIAMANNVFWLVETLKIFLSETTQPMEL